MKKIIYIIFINAIILNLSNFSFAEVGSRGKYGSTPVEILDQIKGKANANNYEIQETALNGVTDLQGSYPQQYKIANTLDYIRMNIDPYLQRIVYIGLSVAVILLIYNGLLMVTNGIHKEGDITKLKKNFINIAIGILLLTGFYFILKLIIGLITSIFGSSGNTP
ncbi:MAG: hypothetical protein WC872_04655 [Candidatus Absconditabacterales bacterium]